MASYIQGINGEDQRLALTIRLWLQSNFSDVFWGHHPLFAKLKAMKQTVTGGFGTRIQVPVKYPAAGGPRAQGVADPYVAGSHKQMTGMSSMLFDTSHYTMLISVPEREMELQGSMTKKVSYMGGVMELASDRFMEDLKAATWAAEGAAGAQGTETTLASWRVLHNKGGASTTGPYTPSPLASQLGTAVGTSPLTKIGDIERDAAGAAYFCVPVINPTDAATMGKAVVNNLVTQGTRGKDRPSVLVLQADHYDILLGILQAQKVTSESKLTDMGFDAFTWRGMDVIFDDDVPSTTASSYNAFALNLNAYKFCVKSLEPNVEKQGVRDDNIIGWKANWFGQLVVTKPGRAQGSRHGKIASV